MDESTDFFLLGLATTCALSELFSAITPPPPHCTFETRGISRAPSELFSATTASPGRLPKSQYFSEFHLGSASAGVKICLANLAKDQNFL